MICQVLQNENQEEKVEFEEPEILSEEPSTSGNSKSPEPQKLVKTGKTKSGYLSEQSDTSDEESCPSLKLSDSSEFEEDDVGEKVKESSVATEEILNVPESEYEKIRSKNIAERESFFENCVNPGMKDLKESLSKKKSKKVKRIYDLPKTVLTRNRSMAKRYEDESSVEGENPSKTSSLRGEEKV